MITPATLKDAAICAQILHDWIAETPWFPNHAPESASLVSMQQRIKNSTVLLVKTGAEVEGFIAFENGYLDCLYLCGKARNKGLGRALLAQAKANSPTGLSTWVLQQNHGAWRFYLREGFYEAEHGDGSDNEENLPDMRMKWQPKEGMNGNVT